MKSERGIVNVENKKFTVVTSFDISSAFPTLSTEIVLKKLKMLGMENNSIQWFSSYFDYRILTTKVGDATSNEISKTTTV